MQSLQILSVCWNAFWKVLLPTACCCYNMMRLYGQTIPFCCDQVAKWSVMHCVQFGLGTVLALQAGSKSKPFRATSSCKDQLAEEGSACRFWGCASTSSRRRIQALRCSRCRRCSCSCSSSLCARHGADARAGTFRAAATAGAPAIASSCASTQYRLSLAS